ncbi:copper transporter [Nonomuraea pusilla]|uniref:Copper transport outer membrane protein, MctB n=1 Tax=Nonomuraea pusilla TaxID=46177 RepID=A0A1H7UUH2_9ACTN|nr:copper transporter [Nonomuraea pusilla]SEM00623.1 Copper transport outer membrane protein, MctB [Nonomuraea pusilla]
MIDFRYHLVSIVAIFLALAVGIVLGTTLLQEPAVRLTQELTAQLTKTNEDLRAQIDTLQGREAGNDAFVAAATPALVAGQLAGQRVVIVEAPGASSTFRESAQQVLEQSGAEITGRVTLTEKYFDPKRSGVLDGLVGQLKPVSMVFPAAATPFDKAATLLASTFVTTDPAQAGTVNTATDGVVTGFETGGLINIDGDPAKRATLAVVLAPERAYEGENAETQAAAFVSLAAGFDTAGKGAVVAGAAATSAVTGGGITAVRDESEISKRVSTVDTLDMPAGRVVLVYSLHEQLSGRAGHYGVGKGASVMQPPLPSATPTPTQSGS